MTLVVEIERTHGRSTYLMSRRARGRGGDLGHEDGALGVHLGVRRGRWAAYRADKEELTRFL